MSESRHLCVEPTFTVGRVATHVALRKKSSPNRRNLFWHTKHSSFFIFVSQSTRRLSGLQKERWGGSDLGGKELIRFLDSNANNLFLHTSGTLGERKVMSEMHRWAGRWMEQSLSLY